MQFYGTTLYFSCRISIISIAIVIVINNIADNYSIFIHYFFPYLDSESVNIDIIVGVDILTAAMEVQIASFELELCLAGWEVSPFLVFRNKAKVGFSFSAFA